MDVDLLRPGTVPISPDTSLWFEFLLDPKHLEKHLNNVNADPTPTELILKFLTTSQAEKFTENGSENKLNTINQNSSKRCLLLKILALKVAAFLRWDFEIFENKVSLSMQATLLKDLLKLVIPEYADVSTHYNVEFSTLNSEALFAVFLYHRWVINSFVNSMLACKSKTNNLTSTDAGCEEVSEALSERSLEVLRKMSNSDLSRGPLVPSLACFTPLSEHTSEIVQHKWELGSLLSVNQFQCQILMDISSYLLFRESYKEARAALRKCQECFHLWKAEPNCAFTFCKVTREVLTGACRAVGILPLNYSPSLLQQFHDSISGMYINVDKILERDNLTKEIPLLFRESLELDIASEVASGKITAHRDVVTQIQASNMVRRALDGGSWHSTNVTPAALNKALTPLVNHVTDLEKERLKYIVGWSLVNGDAKNSRELSDLPVTKELLKEEEILSAMETDYNDPMPTVHEYHQIPMSIIGSPNLELAAIERTILTSYNPHEIKSAVLKLVRQNPSVNLAKLNKNWEIPIPIHNVIMNLPGGVLHNQAFVLLTKFYELDEMKNFAQSRVMLRTVIEDVTEECGNSQQVSKLNQLLMWELLLLDVHQFHAAWPDKHVDWSGLTQRCLQVLHKVEGCLPRVALREQCSLALLNMGQWQALIAAPQVKHSVPLADLYVSLAAACEDINKYNKKINTDAWDKLLPLFASNQKRRDSIVTITNALTSIVEPNALAIVISLLAKLHNVVKEQPQFDLCIQLLHLWPSAIKNSNQYSIKLVSELLYDVLVHALKHYPNNVPWLKLMGDLHFVNAHHTCALCSYLEAAIAGSDYFSRPLHKNVVEDHIYKRMIKSCTALQCHTQAGVLCQFLDDIDYATAFKSLAEGGCSDAMDSYYDCIWDVNILEYLINLHTKKGEHHRRQQVVRIMGLLELNSNNNEEIKREAENLRKGRFMRAMAAQYLS
ncbi:integrator complex subunit 8 [Rhodnius prolixus]|uniref:INTS8 TPR repeats domain-containing protein n=1 Tax=Rhodnius prolixus TaxID=13249 RepID=A0ABL0EET8_RHOPR